MTIKANEELIYPHVESGLLQIDTAGCVWRGNRRAEHSTGAYLQVRVMRQGRRTHALAHRLVWRHFNGPIPNGLTINHKNGMKTDNRPCNLELATYAEQIAHVRDVLGKASQRGHRNNNAKLNMAAVSEIRRRRVLGERLKTIAKDFNISDRTVSKIALGHCWTG